MDVDPSSSPGFPGISAGPQKARVGVREGEPGRGAPGGTSARPPRGARVPGLRPQQLPSRPAAAGSRPGPLPAVAPGPSLALGEARCKPPSGGERAQGRGCRPRGWRTARRATQVAVQGPPEPAPPRENGVFADSGSRIPPRSPDSARTGGPSLPPPAVTAGGGPVPLVNCSVILGASDFKN